MLNRLFRTRLNRIGFLVGLPINFVVIMIVSGVVSAIATFLGGIFGLLVTYSIVIFSVFVFLSLIVRRLNDIGLSQGFILLFFIPPFSFLFPVYLLLRKGEEGLNKYGASPVENSLKSIVIGYKEYEPPVTPRQSQMYINPAQVKKSWIERPRLYFYGGILIGLAPIILFGCGLLIAYSLGCINQGNQECLLLGKDISEKLNEMGMSLMFVFATIPLGFGMVIIAVVLEIKNRMQTVQPTL